MVNRKSLENFKKDIVYYKAYEQALMAYAIALKIGIPTDFTVYSDGEVYIDFCKNGNIIVTISVSRMKRINIYGYVTTKRDYLGTWRAPDDRDWSKLEYMIRRAQEIWDEV